MSTQLLTMDWEAQVKAVLKNWYASEKLEQNPLAQLALVSNQTQLAAYRNDLYKFAKALREVVMSGIKTLGVEGESPPGSDQTDDLKWMDPHWRTYSILFLMSKGLPASEVAESIGLSPGGQYYREQAKAISLLADVLRRRDGTPVEAASQAILAFPSGATLLDDPFYIEREVDESLKKALAGLGGTITIRGARQVGKSSLLVRGIHQAQRFHDAQIIYFDLQSVDEDSLVSLDTFLLVLAYWICDELNIDPAKVDEIWDSRLPAPRKLMKFLERHVLANENLNILLALDEIDRLQLTGFHTDFFSLIRSWHNRRAHDERWNRLNTIMVISTEPYLLIDNLNLSPFNVGLELYMNDFNEDQVQELSQRYGLSLTAADQAESMRLLNGHPYLTRVAFYTMAVENKSWSEFVEIACQEQGPFRQHLHHQHRLVGSDAALKNALQEITRFKRCSDELAAQRLERAGIVRSQNGQYVCRCELYQRYFAERS